MRANQAQAEPTAQLTVRGVPLWVIDRLKARARDSGQSLNRTVLELLTEATGDRRVYQDLDGVVGQWTAEEAQEFDLHLQQQRQIDAELWS